MTFNPPRKADSELLNDLALRAPVVEALQIAIDHENELSSFSRTGMVSAPIDSGSSISPSPKNAHTLRSEGGTMPRSRDAHETRLKNRSHRPNPSIRGKLPEVRHHHG